MVTTVTNQRILGETNIIAAGEAFGVADLQVQGVVLLYFGGRYRHLGQVSR